MEYSPVACMRQSFRGCRSGQFGLLAAQFPFSAGDGHALAGAHAYESGFEPGSGRGPRWNVRQNWLSNRYTTRTGAITIAAARVTLPGSEISLG